MESLVERYSRAIYEIAKEENNVSEYRDIFLLYISALNENKALLDLFDSKNISLEEKLFTASKVFIVNNIMINNGIGVIIRNGRGKYLLKIFKGALSLFNKDLGIVDGIVYSSVKLTNAQITLLENAISKKIDGQVSLKNIIDSSLLGGVKVAIGDTIYDGTIKNKVEELKKALLSRKE